MSISKQTAWNVPFFTSLISNQILWIPLMVNFGVIGTSGSTSGTSGSQSYRCLDASTLTNVLFTPHTVNDGSMEPADCFSNCTQSGFSRGAMMDVPRVCLCGNKDPQGRSIKQSYFCCVFCRSEARAFRF